MQTRLEEFRTAALDACRTLYGPQLVTVAIFGSWARGAATQASDIDLLVVADVLPPSRRKRVAQFATVEAATESVCKEIWGGEHRAPEFSPILKTPSEVSAGSPLFLDMTDWCDILYDRGGFFAAYLKGLRERMRRHGTRRRYTKGGYYWEYKPDLKPPEIVEL